MLVPVLTVIFYSCCGQQSLVWAETERTRGTVFSEECWLFCSENVSGEPQGLAVPLTGSCCLAFLAALPLLVRMLSASPDFPATGLAVMVVAASLSLSALSNGCAFEGEGGSRPGAERVGAHPRSVSLHWREVLRDKPRAVGAVEPYGNQCLCFWEQGSKWLVEPRFQVALCRGAHWSCIFNTVGYKWPIFTSAYIIYIIPSLPSSLSDVLCIDLSFTLQLHFALLHFNDIWSSFIHIWVHWYKWKRRNNQHTWFIWWHKNVIS